MVLDIHKYLHIDHTHTDLPRNGPAAGDFLPQLEVTDPIRQGLQHEGGQQDYQLLKEQGAGLPEPLPPELIVNTDL